MLHSLGIPTWFLTLSAADLHWPEMIQAVALQLGRRLSRDDVLKMSIAQRSTYLQQNPITGVCMFQHRLQSLFSQYLLNDAHPLGHITDYVIKIEFQMRGSPHAHCLLWVKDAPKLIKIQMMMCADSLINTLLQWCLKEYLKGKMMQT